MIQVSKDLPWDLSAPRFHPTCRYLVIGGTKGGPGKSTIAFNLAIAIARLNKRVLLVDGDPQETVTMNTRKRRSRSDADRLPKYGFTQYFETKKSDPATFRKYGDDFDYIIFDVGGFASQQQRFSAGICDLMLCPLRPKENDINGLKQTIELIRDHINDDVRRQAGLNPIQGLILFNQMEHNPNSHANQRAKSFSGVRDSAELEVLDLPIRTNVAFEKALLAGLGVVEAFDQEHPSVRAINRLANFVIRG